MAEESLSQVNEETEKESPFTLCGSCNVTFEGKTSKILPCLHCFCEDCLAGKQTAEKQTTEDNSDKSESEEAAKVVSSTDADSCIKDAGNSEGDSSEPDLQTEGDGDTRNGNTNVNGTPASTPPLENKNTSCPICKVEYKAEQVIDNPFCVAKTPKLDPQNKSDDGCPSEEKFNLCTGCDETQKATSFCIQCKDWLCDQCVIAHKRVRLTKDHTFSSKQEPDTSWTHEMATVRQVFCTDHKTERLKLFCTTCEKLTCRDCQLQEHKDHKYQFIDEATITQQKSDLEKSLQDLKDQLKLNVDLAKTVLSREKEIKQEQMKVFNEVRQVADTVTNEIIGYCKRLLNFLSGVCHGKVKTLADKKTEVDAFTKNASHCISFVESALKSGDDLSVLHTKSYMAKQLVLLLGKKIEVVPAMFELRMKYENDATFLTQNVLKMGTINVNGRSYPQEQTPPAAAQPPQNNSSQLPLPQGNNQSTFSKQVADLLNKYPPHVREAYKKMNSQDRNRFLHQLVRTHMKHPKPGQPPQQGQQQRFVNDTSALNDLYRNHYDTAPPPPHLVQSSGTYYPRGSSGHLLSAFQQSRPPPMNGGRPDLGPSFSNWRGGSLGQPPYSPTQGLHTPSASYPMSSLVGGPSGHSGHTGIVGETRLYTPPQSSPGPQVAAGPQGMLNQMGAQGLGGSFGFQPSALNNSRLEPTAGSQPPGQSIDPARVKQEPRDRFPPSCAFSSPASNLARQVAAANSVSLLPGTPPTTQIQPQSTSITATSSSPIPSAGRMVSPVIPDSNVIEKDAHEALKALTSNYQLNTKFLNEKHDPDDPSEDYCAVCHNGGDLLCCDRCPKVFHHLCHIPCVTERIDQREPWLCMLCVDDAELRLETPVAKDDIIMPNSGKRKAPCGLDDKELKVCERILLELFCMESSAVFHEPVNKNVPNYYKIIAYPMDFATIKKKLKRDNFSHYNCIEDFLTDLKFVFNNCYKYNGATTDVYQVGKSVECLLEFLLKRFLPCYTYHYSQLEPTVPVDSSDSFGERSRPKKRRSPAPDLIAGSAPSKAPDTAITMSSTSSSIDSQIVHFT